MDYTDVFQVTCDAWHPLPTNARGAASEDSMAAHAAEGEPGCCIEAWMLQQWGVEKRKTLTLTYIYIHPSSCVSILAPGIPCRLKAYIEKFMAAPISW